MKKEEKIEKEGKCCCEGKLNSRGHHHGGGHSDSGTIYGMGLIGALFYFLQGVSGFGPIMIGIGKAIFWPALVLFKVLTYLQV